MGQAFWTGVRLPSSPPELKGITMWSLFCMQEVYIDKFKYIEYNKYIEIKTAILQTIRSVCI